MTRRQLHRALARRTGESLAVLRRLGFQFWTVPTPPARRCPPRARPRPTMVPAA